MNARLHLPPRAQRGAEVQVRLILQHPMENGLRRDELGRLVAYSVVERLVCRYNGAEVFAAEMGPGIAANPYLSFPLVAANSGEVSVEWVTTEGQRGTVSAVIAVD